MKAANQEKSIIKPFKKLRIIDNKLVEDNRIFQSIQRKITGDSRYKTLDYLKTDLNNKEILYTLKNTTYKNDVKFIQEVNKLIDSKNEYKENIYKTVYTNKNDYIKSHNHIETIKKLFAEDVNICSDPTLFILK